MRTVSSHSFLVALVAGVLVMLAASLAGADAVGFYVGVVVVLVVAAMGDLAPGGRFHGR